MIYPQQKNLIMTIDNIRNILYNYLTFNMAANRANNKGSRGDMKKRDFWSREYNNKSGGSSPRSRRSNSPRNSQFDNKERKESSHRLYASHLLKEWEKVESDLKKDERPTGTVEYITKEPLDIKEDNLCKVEAYLKNREESSPD
ncbi:uncharacterized protein LOC124447924 isoform X2 [Xenia sp. Carnegie-2017]|uniref:uncharacterized protein LOC124447924 isoform X2 n=1 Tax=Xenia sp. Carnegie-2017 TaxID=2897299 RepID=UPI001F04A672|nr:uncharacterized protein LOC124447924 isoform X2 [Xenia sp. Carnegie-2017]